MLGHFTDLASRAYGLLRAGSRSFLDFASLWAEFSVLGNNLAFSLRLLAEAHKKTVSIRAGFRYFTPTVAYSGLTGFPFHPLKMKQIDRNIF
ncbi:hypothetical protein SAMN06265337_0928 [Hymenobacter gelipurpurascens]|uniref:Uncharacterized protein n=1 Tax=Hymenobacter gelipurpurascens TaxID=89968 RepID=A0A212TCY7_9BACT|nr:hypothetical protein SAMN06265337_0928 [Hymenobacter gelipurpurascens]